MNEKPKTYELTTLEDVALLYAELPEERAELLLKEMADAMRIIGPIAKATNELGGKMNFLPIRWVNDTKGRATLNVKTPDDSLNMSASFDLPNHKETP